MLNKKLLHSSLSRLLLDSCIFQMQDKCSICIYISNGRQIFHKTTSHSNIDSSFANCNHSSRYKFFVFACTAQCAYNHSFAYIFQNILSNFHKDGLGMTCSAQCKSFHWGIKKVNFRKSLAPFLSESIWGRRKIVSSKQVFFIHQTNICIHQIKNCISFDSRFFFH